MDLEKILDSLETLIYQVLALIYFIPKTVFKLITTKNNITYVSNEFDKPENDRFKEFTSPLRLFICLLIIYFFLELKNNNSPILNDFLAPYIDDQTQQKGGNPIETTDFYKILISYAAFIVWPATNSMWVAKVPINLDSFKRVIYCCFCIGCYALILLIVTYSMYLIHNLSYNETYWATFILGIFAAIKVIIEYVNLLRLLKIRLWPGVFLFAFNLISFGGYFFLIFRLGWI